ncbi:MAG: ABC transporter permease [Defluviitaleaceae bacterium]|nr:ABC transporter permease [Defluviitaleaceae bacterium]
MRGRILGLIPWAVILAALVAFQARIEGQAADRLPDTAQISLSGGLSRDAYMNIEGQYNLNDIGFAAQDGYAQTPGGAGAGVNLTFAQAGYGWAAKLNMTSGAFFPDTAENLAVIDEGLALTLYMSTDIIGAPLDINGFTYTICGVCKNEESFAGALSRDGKMAVYLPLRSEAGKSANLNDIFVVPAEGEALGPALQNRLDILSNAGIPVANVRDHTETLGLLRQDGRIQRFFIFIGAAVCLGFFGIRRVIALAKERLAIRKNRDPQAGKRLNISELLLCVALCAAAAVFAALARFRPYLPSGLLTPAGRIDFGYLFRLFVQDTQKLNDGADFWARYGHRVMVWSGAACAATLAVAARVSVKVMKMGSKISRNI